MSGSCRRIDRSALANVSDLLVDLRLVDAGDLRLDRILDRDDVGLHAHKHHAEAFPRTFVLRERGAEIVLCDEARLDQALTDFLPGPSAKNVRAGADFRL